MAVLTPLAPGSVNLASPAPQASRDRKREPRGKRDENEVRRSRSALVLFTEASRARLKALHPAAKYADVTRLASTEYKAMGAEARAEWEKASVDDKLRFVRETSAAARGSSTADATAADCPTAPSASPARVPLSSGGRRVQRRIVMSDDSDTGEDEPVLLQMQTEEDLQRAEEGTTSERARADADATVPLPPGGNIAGGDDDATVEYAPTRSDGEDTGGGAPDGNDTDGGAPDGPAGVEVARTPARGNGIATDAGHRAEDGADGVASAHVGLPRDTEGRDTEGGVTPSPIITLVGTRSPARAKRLAQSARTAASATSSDGGAPPPGTPPLDTPPLGIDDGPPPPGTPPPDTPPLGVTGLDAIASTALADAPPPSCGILPLPPPPPSGPAPPLPTPPPASSSPGSGLGLGVRVYSDLDPDPVARCGQRSGSSRGSGCTSEYTYWDLGPEPPDQGALQLGLYTIFFYFKACVHESIILYCGLTRRAPPLGY